MVTLILDPLETAQRYARLIRDEEWSEIRPDTLMSLLQDLSFCAHENLDEPMSVRITLSGAQAKAALSELFRALAGPRVGRRKSRAKAEAEFARDMEPLLIEGFFRVDGAPTRSFAEYHAWEATELLRARAEASRRNRKAPWQEVSTREVFRERMLPRLGAWKGGEEEDLSERVLARMYNSALETIGLAGKPTPRAVRAALGLTYRAHRSRARVRRLQKSAAVRPAIKITSEELRARGLKILGEKPHT